MAELRLDFPLAGGLHARPAAALRERAAALGVAGTFHNERNGRHAALDSVLELLATGTRAGDPCRVNLDGPGIEDLRAFLEGPFLAVDDPVADAAPAAAAVPDWLSGLSFRTGTPLAPGLARGPLRRLPPASIRAEPATSLEAALADLDRDLRLEARRRPEARTILEAHRALLADPGWTGPLRAALEAGTPPLRALAEATEAAAAALAATPSARAASRAEDLRGLAERLEARLLGRAAAVEPPFPCILAADRLTPSRLLALDRSRLLGLLLAEGNPASHTAILARALQVPCLVAAAADLAEGADLLLDGGRGLLLADPPPEVAARFQAEEGARTAREARRAARAAAPAATADGHPVAVMANVGGPEEAAFARARGADGIGVLRTELLFLDRPEAPTEDEQADLYAAVLKAAAGRPVVLRLLDAGGDKPMPFLPLPAEANPYLGRRGVRWYRRHPGLVDTQLRAALRAAPAGDLRLLVPMVSLPDELAWVRGRLAAAAADLGVAPPPLGMMVEVPAAALDLRAFAGVADFLSVGSNDLVQYLFAADRDDPGLCPESRSTHPAMLRLLARMAAEARDLGLELSLCGALASDLRALPLLLGLGLDHLSAVPSAVPDLKARIRTLDLGACRALAEAAQAARSEAEVADLLAGFAPPEPPLVAADLVALDLPCASKDDALDALVDLLADAGRCTDPPALRAAVAAREATSATAIGHGFAVPHAKVPGLGSGGLAVLRTAQPVDWGSADGLPVHTVLLLAGDDREAHLRAFARLARRLMDPDFRAALTGAADPAAVAALLRPALA